VVIEAGLETWFVLTDESMEALARFDLLVDTINSRGTVWRTERDGWHIVSVGFFPWPLSEEIKAALLSVRASLVIAGGSVPGLHVVASAATDPQIETTFAPESYGFNFERPESTFRLLEWMRSYGPSKPTNSDLQFMLADAKVSKGRDVARVLLSRLGWPSEPPQPWQMLGECSGPCHGVLPTLVGSVYPDWDQYRWVIARGKGFVGLWDTLSPSSPVLRWPETDAVTLSKVKKQYFLAPLYGAERWIGIREWAPAAEKFEPAVIYHLDPQFRLTAVCAREVPFTIKVSLHREALLRPRQAEEIGITTPAGKDGYVHLPLRTRDDARMAATAMAQSSLIAEWQPIPSKVPNDAWSSIMWVVKHQHGESADHSSGPESTS
jgi:hypothetical protein